ncbi:uncharacterized protein [Palaemon carinicauda]|uniref:uncharacterized protein n=1 Tax=Palaemon carinicauda TaxID=392227 RepID=UPI0035B6AAF4
MSLLDISKTPSGLDRQTWRASFLERWRLQGVRQNLDMKHFDPFAAYQRQNSKQGTSDGKNKTCLMKKKFLSAPILEENRNFINHGAVEGENELCNGNLYSPMADFKDDSDTQNAEIFKRAVEGENKLCNRESNLPTTNFEDDLDTQDQAIIKIEEFEDDSEMNYQSDNLSTSKSRPTSVDGIGNSKEISHSSNTAVYTVQSPCKKINMSRSPFEGVNNLQSSLTDVNQFQTSFKDIKRPRLSLGKIPKTSKCFCCQRNVKEDHFPEHLFFGEAKCSKCKSYFRNCQIFSAWASKYAFEYVKCDHNFVFVNDPFVYITENLSLGEAEHGLQNEELLSALEKYICKITSLESRFPWKYAINKCRYHIALQRHKNMHTSNNAQSDLGDSRNVSEYREAEYSKYSGYTEADSRDSSQISRGTEEVDDKGKDYFTLIERNGFSELTGEGKSNISGGFEDERSQNTKECSTPKRAEVTCSQFPHASYNGDTNHQLSDESLLSCMIGTSKGLEESLPNQIGLKNGTHEISSHKTSHHSKDKVCSKKRKNKQNSTTEKPFLKIDTYMSLSMVEQPSDGFYFITQSPIEECPNCYCILCPSRCTVNCKTFLITFICPDCDLVIYIANDDTIILTEEVDNSAGGLLN